MKNPLTHNGKKTLWFFRFCFIFAVIYWGGWALGQWSCFGYWYEIDMIITKHD